MRQCLALLSAAALACAVVAGQPVAVAPPIDNRRLVLKPDAPEPVRRWFNWLPVAKQKEVDRRRDQLVRTMTRLDDSRAELRRLSTAPVPTIVVGRDNFGQEIRRRDERAIQQRQERIRELRKLIPGLITDIRTQEKALAEFEADPIYLVIPSWSPTEPKLLGRVDSLRVFQIVGQTSMLVRTGRNVLFLEGVPTEGLADDDVVCVSAIVVATGTRTYQATSGAQRTVHVVEQIDPLAWVEIVTDPPATP